MADSNGGLDSFDRQTRSKALELCMQGQKSFDSFDRINLHLHSFFSYNAQGWSPSRIAWEAAQAGLIAAGLCDFDVLDGMEEFFDAGERLGLRTTVNLETRTFYGDLSTVEIDSPGEPGVSYLTGAGFTDMPAASGDSGAFLRRLRETAERRNRDLIERINPHVGVCAVDYEQDVLPLTPGGNATERHIMAAYVDKANSRFAHRNERARYWSALLGKPVESCLSLIDNRPDLETSVRNRLAKKGGPGYVQPTADTFPAVESFFDWVKSCDAIPMESWLDGTSAGEQDGRALLELSMSKGAAALNIIPNRNWNISDASVKAQKMANLAAIVETATALGLPVNIGTELNKLGQPLFDDLECAALKPFREIFLDGARIMVGHTVMARFAGVSYSGEDAMGEFGGDIRRKNAFFAAVGGLPPVNGRLSDSLREQGMHRAYTVIRDSVRKGTWVV